MRNLEELLEIQDAGNLTLEEDLAMTGMAISAVQDALSDGQIWTRRESGDLSKMCAIVDQLLSYLGQATVAHSRLRFWMAQNGYATGLPIRTILQNYTLGSILLRELIDALSLALGYAEEWNYMRAEESNAQAIVDHGL